MPKYTPSEDEMDDSYKEPAAADTEPMAKAESPEGETVDEENATAPEILVAKNKLPSGVKEGDECTFRVTKDFGDEVSVEYVKKPETKTYEPSPAEELAALDTGEE